MNIREMKIEDYDKVFALWKTIKGFGIRSVDDSKEEIERFLKWNPGLSVVAEENGEIVGAILCGSDGRRGCLYHVCVRQEYRMLGIGQDMVECCKAALRKEGINKINLIAFKSNAIAILFLYLIPASTPAASKPFAAVTPPGICFIPLIV